MAKKSNKPHNICRRDPRNEKDRTGSGAGLESGAGMEMGTGTGMEKKQGRERGWRRTKEHKVGTGTGTGVETRG